MSANVSELTERDKGGHPATPLQERHWYLHHYDPDPASQNVSLVAEYQGPASADQILSIAHHVFQRYPQLLQRFTSRDGELRVDTGVAPRLAATRTSSEAELNLALSAAERRPLDLDTGSTASFEVVFNDEVTCLCLVAHACVADHPSLEILLEDIGDELDRESATNTVDETGRAGDSPAWISASLSGAGRVSGNTDGAPYRSGFENRADSSVADAEAYWVRRLGGEVEPLQLPAARTRPTMKRHEAGSSILHLGRNAQDGLERFLSQIGGVAETAYLAAFLIALRRWTGQTALTVGRQVDLRPAGGEGAVGPFTEETPFRVDIPSGTSVRALVKHIEHLQSEDRSRGAVSFNRLTRLIDVPRDQSRHPIHQAAFRFSESPPTAIRRNSWSLHEAPERQTPRTVYDVELHVRAKEDGTSLTVLFDDAIYDKDMMDRFVKHCANVIERLHVASEADVDEIELLDSEERARILELGRGADAAIEHTCVHDLFHRAVAQFGDCPALEFKGQTLSYRQLDAWSNRLANALESRGVAPGARVGVCMDRSLEMVAAVLAILKAGAAYVPMDPTYPVERLRIMAEDSGALLVLVHANRRDRLVRNPAVLSYEELAESASATTEQRTHTPSDLKDLAYVIFTSGSTGRPKGVAMPHRALVNLLEWQLQRESFSARARVLQYSSLSFDVSFQEIFSTFASGGVLYLIDDEDRRDPRRLLDSLIEHRIQRLFLPYVALRQMVDVAEATGRCPSHLREVITAGEQLQVDPSLRAFFSRIDGASLDNQYGPSETHVITAYMLQGDPSGWPALPPIGRPIQNNQTLILDDRGSPTPLGVRGELFLAGENLAQGYFGRNDLTQERFISSSLVAGPTYRTGDVARYRSDGSIEFLGRSDFQVKVRGHRIEPNEINDVLGRLPRIRQCITRAVESGASGTRLVTYILVDELDHFDLQTVVDHARKQLPDYMVPSAIVPVTSLPFTPSGKVDLRALPVPDGVTQTARRLDPPGNPTEVALVAIWRDLLKLEQVGTNESFFEVGGDSLMAVRLFLAIEQRFGVDLPLAMLAEQPTIAELADAISGGLADDLAGFKSLRRIQRGTDGAKPLFLVHGGGGNVLLFERLAKAISSKLPVYAFAWDGWSGARGQTTIENMADLYVEELSRYYTDGPIRLGGHCIGGLIAIEMARRLRRLGREVIDPIFITDTPNLSAASYHPSLPPQDSPEAKHMQDTRRELDMVLQRCATHPSSDLELFEPPPHHKGRPRRLLLRYLKLGSRLLGQGKPNALQFNQSLDRVALGLYRILGLSIPLRYRALHATTTLVHAASAYRPTPYEGKVVYFRTRLFLGENLGLSGWWADTCLGFAELCPKGIHVHYINATHNGVVNHPQTAEVIRGALCR